ncbi:hypothetical protein ACFUMH_09525 [Cellulomonas sp. NPDC057328]|uniref:hypothetical protein n=1 Tax=Cellulomonas sp. NPDC057328 TaxID=3346101 RepID=UPI00364534B0
MSGETTFVEDLRARADAAAPTVVVDVPRVVRLGRRRRASRVAAAAVLSVVALAGAGLAASTQLGLVDDDALLQPAWRGLPWEDVAPPGSTPTPATSPTVQPDGTVVGGVGDPWPGDEPYWYTLSEQTQTGYMDDVPQTTTYRSESWLSRERPGLLVTDGDVAGATAVGPRQVVGRFRIDGAWVDTLADPARLPDDPGALAAVLRDSVEPGRRQGTPDDKVVEMAMELVRDPLLPAGLRDAAWQVAADVPGGSLSDGTDTTGRPGQVLRYDRGEGPAVTYVRDPSSGLLLELADEAGWHVVYLEQRAADVPPVAPTAERAGCVQWATC